MGQDSTWHLQQLNQYVSAFTSGLSGGDNFTTITTTISINSSVISNSSNTSSSNGLVRHHHHQHQPLQQQFHPSNNTSSSLLSTSAHRELQNFSQAIAERLTAAAVSQLTSTSINDGGAATQSTTYHVDVDDADTNTVIWNNWLLLLIVLYCIVVFGGIFGNASLVLTLYTQTSTRLRNPLLVALCLADLMVTGVAAPLTVVTLVLMVKRSWTFSSVYACKSIYFLQVSSSLHRVIRGDPSSISYIVVSSSITLTKMKLAEILMKYSCMKWIESISFGMERSTLFDHHRMWSNNLVTKWPWLISFSHRFTSHTSTSTYVIQWFQFRSLNDFVPSTIWQRTESDEERNENIKWRLLSSPTFFGKCPVSHFHLTESLFYFGSVSLRLGSLRLCDGPEYGDEMRNKT